MMIPPFFQYCGRGAIDGVAAPAPPLLTCDAADFDGTNDYMTRGAAITGIADSKIFSFNGWLNPTTGSGAKTIFIVEDVASIFQVQYAGATGVITVLATDGVVTSVLSMTSTSSVTFGSWNHVAISVDLSDTAKRWIYINGADATPASPVTYVNTAIGFSIGTNAEFGGRFLGTGKITSGAAEIAFWPGSYLNLSDPATLAKLMYTNKPVNMGTDASTPTGVAAICYFHLDDAEAPANFALNRGTGGDFTVVGTLTTSATSPSD